MKPPVLLSAVVSAFLVVAFPVLSSAAVVTFSDGTFLSSGWTTTVQSVNAGGTCSGSQVVSGGSPGDYRQVAITLNGSNGLDNAVWSFHAKTGATYTPSSSGAILSIKYSESSINLTSVQACGMAIRQGGVIYYGPRFVPGSSWASTTQLALTAASFDALPAGVQNPNFTTTGGTIEFGFLRANSTGVGGPGYSTLGGLDNWSVELTTDGPVKTESSTWGKIKALYRD